MRCSHHKRERADAAFSGSTLRALSDGNTIRFRTNTEFKDNGSLKSDATCYGYCSIADFHIRELMRTHRRLAAARMSRVTAFNIGHNELRAFALNHIS